VRQPWPLRAQQDVCGAYRVDQLGEPVAAGLRAAEDEPPAAQLVELPVEAL
jgi:hypothetical protein